MERELALAWSGTMNRPSTMRSGTTPGLGISGVSTKLVEASAFIPFVFLMVSSKRCPGRHCGMEARPGESRQESLPSLSNMI